MRLDLVVVLSPDEEHFLAFGLGDVLHVDLEWPLELEVHFRDHELVADELPHHELPLIAVDGFDGIQRAGEDLFRRWN